MRWWGCEQLTRIHSWGQGCEIRDGERSLGCRQHPRRLEEDCRQVRVSACGRRGRRQASSTLSHTCSHLTPFPIQLLAPSQPFVPKQTASYPVHLGQLQVRLGCLPPHIPWSDGLPVLGFRSPCRNPHCSQPSCCHGRGAQLWASCTLSTDS